MSSKPARKSRIQGFLPLLSIHFLPLFIYHSGLQSPVSALSSLLSNFSSHHLYSHNSSSRHHPTNNQNVFSRLSCHDLRESSLTASTTHNPLTTQPNQPVEHLRLHPRIMPERKPHRAEDPTHSLRRSKGPSLPACPHPIHPHLQAGLFHPGPNQFRHGSPSGDPHSGGDPPWPFHAVRLQETGCGGLVCGCGETDPRVWCCRCRLVD